MAKLRLVVETSEAESEMSYDEILAVMFSAWVERKGLTLARVSEISGVAVEEIEAFVAGDAPAPEKAFAPLLTFAGSTMAEIDRGVIEFRRPSTPPPIDLSAGYWVRVGRLWPDSFARFLLAASPHLRRNPSIGHSITEGIKLLVRIAATTSDDVENLESAASETVEEFYRMERDAGD